MYCWPEESALGIQRPIAIIHKENRSEAATELAKELVNFSLSPQAQTIFSNFGFVSVLKSAEKPSFLPDNAPLKQVNWESIVQEEKDFLQQYSSIYPPH